jgi:hypothetical protein
MRNCLVIDFCVKRFSIETQFEKEKRRGRSTIGSVNDSKANKDDYKITTTKENTC